LDANEKGWKFFRLWGPPGPYFFAARPTY
jgi:hypothetical protein